MNIIIYLTNDEFFKINLNKTFRVILRDASNRFNRAARFNITRATSYFNKSETHVCKQRTNDQCRTYR